MVSHLFCVCLHRLDTASLRFGEDKPGDEEDAGRALGPVAPPPLLPSRPAYEGPLPSPPQKAFQPGSTPAHLTHRFMVGCSPQLSSITRRNCRKDCKVHRNVQLECRGNGDERKRKRKKRAKETMNEALQVAEAFLSGLLTPFTPLDLCVMANRGLSAFTLKRS